MRGDGVISFAALLARARTTPSAINPHGSVSVSGDEWDAILLALRSAHEARELLLGIDYYEGSRIDRAVRRMDPLDRFDWRDA